MRLKLDGAQSLTNANTPAGPTLSRTGRERPGTLGTLHFKLAFTVKSVFDDYDIVASSMSALNHLVTIINSIVVSAGHCYNDQPDMQLYEDGPFGITINSLLGNTYGIEAQ